MTKKEIEKEAEKYSKYIKSVPAKHIIVECPKEIFRDILGQKLITFEIITDPRSDSLAEEAYNSSEELFLEFDSGKEMRIYIDKENNLVVYTD